MKKILFAASECVPFIKTGGLADVIGSLPQALDREKYEVRVMIPAYTIIPEQFRSEMKTVCFFQSFFNGRDRYVGVKELVRDGIIYDFIDNEEYFGGSYPYTDYYYDIEKFCFFCKAVLSVLPSLGFRPDIIHCNDWHTGLIPVYLKIEFAGDPFYQGMKSIMTVHNLKFQGVFNASDMSRISGLPIELFTVDKLLTYNDGNMLKGGLVYADKITTVSETYAEEIKTPEYGEGLDGIFRARWHEFRGIVNGIDVGYYDPATDPDIAENFTAKDLSGKAADKADLEDVCGFVHAPYTPIIAMVSRLAAHKGFDLVKAVLEEIITTENVRFVLLGTGEPELEDYFRDLAYRYPDKVCIRLEYNKALSKKFYAGADMFLMPSKSEPCGLSQMIASRYGTVPIVRECGGLADTIHPYNEFDGTGNGFTFANYNAHEMMHVIRYALQVSCDPAKWENLVKNVMLVDFSWNVSAKRYIDIYSSLK